MTTRTPARVRASLGARVPLLAVLAALAALVVPVAPADARTLGHGSRGAAVERLQRLLAQAGFATSADGVFGSGTARSVRRFERALGLRVDGRVTRRDLRHLRTAVAVADSGGLGAGALPAHEARAEAAPAAAAEVPATAPGDEATLTADGLAVAPASAPPVVKRVIAAANEIARTPYRYGGGHGRWRDSGYDCSGSVSYALHGGGLLDAAMPSGSFTSWGQAGAGKWITIYANGGHMYMTVAGLRFDTSGRAASGSRWQRQMRSPAGYAVRHPAGL